MSDTTEQHALSSLPSYNVTGRALWDLEMLTCGGFAPLTGFMTHEEYESVLDTMRLPSGALWPVPVVFDVNDDFQHATGETIVLCDPYGYPLATLCIADMYTPDKAREAERVYGTQDPEHFGVRHLLSDLGNRYVGGTVTRLAQLRQHDFRHLRHTPHELRTLLRKNGHDRVVAFQTRNPMHRAHVELVRQAAHEHDAHVLVHPVVGMTKSGDIDYVTRVRSYERLFESHMDDAATLSLLPLAMRMAGPREALWHALIRKNYGATHFIVGRDHAGPGKDKEGKPFYDPYAAQDLVRAHEKEIGVSLVLPREMVYVKDRATYVPIDKVQKDETVQRISGTELRQMLQDGTEVPSWFSYPEVMEELVRRSEYVQQQGFVLFFTGLSGSGKSTVAEELHTVLQERVKREITFLDGDVIRLHLSKGLGFSKEDRDANIERIGFVAGEVVRHGGIAICSAIAPYRTPRQKNRQRIGELGTYIEVYMATPLAVCKERDAKGLYEKAEKGIIKNFTGISDPYEEPRNAEIVLDTSQLTVDQSVDTIMRYLTEHKLIART
jgi:sulfate adenylyltransferase